MPTFEEIQTALADSDRNVDAIIPFRWMEEYPNNAQTDQGVISWVYDVRQGEKGLEVRISEQDWTVPIEVRLGWNLCDGCHAVESQCCCDEIEAEYEAEHGPYCHRCSSYGGENCPYAHLYAPGECVGITGVW